MNEQTIREIFNLPSEQSIRKFLSEHGYADAQRLPEHKKVNLIPLIREAHIKVESENSGGDLYLSAFVYDTDKYEYITVDIAKCNRKTNSWLTSKIIIYVKEI